ncbi:MAG: hypothetical protein IIZ70_04380 [Kiritimatiellae bacterium]|nr:hypothetical protein [Kiritimatiellia bacterium]
MLFFASILAAAVATNAAPAASEAPARQLTREEIIARFKAPPTTRVSGLVQVIADCPADMRREYQGPIARFAADICNDLYRHRRVQPVLFKEPGLIIHIGDVRTNEAAVAAVPSKRDDGTFVTRIYIPAPGFADLHRLGLDVVRAFSRAVDRKEISDDDALALFRAANPELKADYEYEMIDKWIRGEKVDRSEEEMFKLMRSVITPGIARESDVLRFAARLRLYPESYDRPFCEKYHCIDFSDAIRLRERDPRIRLVAYLKARSIVLFGGGRGEALTAAAEAYSKFLLELAADRREDADLRALLADADGKLEVALEEARKYDIERTKR